ncbi:hypothetical protein LTS15_001524 [Exophiala xenobiotica]|nr:hypothetical protein LTS15_001524 [Exophiala xenobiotica]
MCKKSSARQTKDNDETSPLQCRHDIITRSRERQVSQGQDTNTTEVHLPLGCDESATTNSSEENSPKHHQMAVAPIWSMIRRNATDPFNTSCITIDDKVHQLLQYALNVSHPRNWHAEARAYRGQYRFRQFATDRIVNCLINESSMFAMMASSASQMHYFEGLAPPTDTAVLICKAIQSTRQRLQVCNTVDINIIYDIHTLANADFFRFDVQAARMHVGGLKSLDPAWREWFILGDEFIAAELLDRPFFHPDDYDPGPLRDTGLVIGENHRHDHNAFIASIDAFMTSPQLKNIMVDLVAFNQEMKLQLSAGHGTEPQVAHERVRWRHLRAATLRSRLLHYAAVTWTEEVSRLALLTWMYMVTSVVGRRRTMKVLSARLQVTLTRGSGHAWQRDPFLLWALLVGACASEGNRGRRKWYWNVAGAVYSLVSAGDKLSGDVVFGSLDQFLYVSEVQRPMMEELLGEVFLHSTLRKSSD